MPTVNKQSLRHEFDQIKVRFDSLSTEGKISPEASALIQSMIMLFELLIAVFMEKTTRKNNRNSSIPSSQTEKAMATKFSWILLNHEHFSKASGILSGKLSIFINFLKPGSTLSV